MMSQNIEILSHNYDKKWKLWVNYEIKSEKYDNLNYDLLNWNYDKIKTDIVITVTYKIKIMTKSKFWNTKWKLWLKRLNKFAEFLSEMEYLAKYTTLKSCDHGVARL